MQKMRVVVLSAAVIIGMFFGQAQADILYLKNGRSLDGLIKSEDDSGVELELGFGIIKFTQQQIARIDRSTPAQATEIRLEWDEKKRLDEQQDLARRQLAEQAPKQIDVLTEQGHIILPTLINKKATARLMMDTGASVIVLSKKIAKELGLNTNPAKENLAKMITADGREHEACAVTLSSVKIEDVEAKDVQAVVILDEVASESSIDGLLGMSFLGRYNFSIDGQKNRLILEPRKNYGN